MSNIAKVVRR